MQDYKILILKPLNFTTFMIYLLFFNHLMAFALAAVCLACNLCWWPCYFLLYVSWFHLLSSSFLHNVMTIALAPIKKTSMNVEMFRSSNWRSTWYCLRLSLGQLGCKTREAMFVAIDHGFCRCFYAAQVHIEQSVLA